MLKLMEIKSFNPEVTQKQITKEMVVSDSSIKTYRIDIDMTSFYNGIGGKANKNSQ